MAGQVEATVVSLAKMEKWLRVLWLVLLAFNAVMLVITVPPLIRGEGDEYFHQHARLVTGFVSGFLLSAAFLARSTLKTVLWIAACASIVVSVWLAIP